MGGGKGEGKSREEGSGDGRHGFLYVEEIYQVRRRQTFFGVQRMHLFLLLLRHLSQEYAAFCGVGGGLLHGLWDPSSSTRD